MGLESGAAQAREVTVLVDTTVWSLALRRRRVALSAAERGLVRELESLLAEGRVLLAGAVRQEILTGVRDEAAFERLRERLASFEDVPVETADHEMAAAFANRCLGAGVAVASTDLLLCAVASRRGAAVFTTDPDFARHAEVVPVRLHVPSDRGAR